MEPATVTAEQERPVPLLCLSLDKTAERRFRSEYRKRNLSYALCPARSRPDSAFTHLLTSSVDRLVRTERLLVALARGAPVLDAFLVLPLLSTECAIDQAIVTQTEINLEGDWAVNLWLGAPRYWRRKRERSGVGAFDGQVLAFGVGLSKSKKELCATLVREGGGQYVEGDANETPTFVIGKHGGTHTRVPILKPEFVMDLLSLVEIDAKSYVIEGNGQMEWASLNKHDQTDLEDNLQVSSTLETPHQGDQKGSPPRCCYLPRPDGLGSESEPSPIQREQQLLKIPVPLTQTVRLSHASNDSSVALGSHLISSQDSEIRQHKRPLKRVSRHIVDDDESGKTTQTPTSSLKRKPNDISTPEKSPKSMRIRPRRLLDESTSDASSCFERDCQPPSRHARRGGNQNVKADDIDSSLDSERAKMSDACNIANKIDASLPKSLLSNDGRTDKLARTAHTELTPRIISTPEFLVNNVEEAVPTTPPSCYLEEGPSRNPETLDIEGDGTISGYFADVAPAGSLSDIHPVSFEYRYPFSCLKPEMGLELIKGELSTDLGGPNHCQEIFKEALIPSAHVDGNNYFRSAAMHARLRHHGDSTEYLALPFNGDCEENIEWIFSQGSLGKATDKEAHGRTSIIYRIAIQYAISMATSLSDELIGRIMEDLTELYQRQSNELPLAEESIWRLLASYSRPENSEPGSLFWKLLIQTVQKRLAEERISGEGSRDLVLRCLIITRGGYPLSVEIRSLIWNFLQQSIGTSDVEEFSGALPQTSLYSLLCAPTDPFMDFVLKWSGETRERRGCECLSIHPTHVSDINFKDNCSMVLMLVRVCARHGRNQSFVSRILQRERRHVSKSTVASLASLAHSASLVLSLGPCFKEITGLVALVRKTIFNGRKGSGPLVRNRLFIDALRCIWLSSPGNDKEVGRDLSKILGECVPMCVRGREALVVDEHDNSQRGFALDHAREQQRELASTIFRCVQFILEVAKSGDNSLSQINSLLGPWLSAGLTQESVGGKLREGLVSLVNVLLDKILESDQDSPVDSTQDSDTLFDDIDESQIIVRYEITSTLHKCLPPRVQFDSDFISGSLAAKMSAAVVLHGVASPDEIILAISSSTFGSQDRNGRTKARGKKIRFWATLSGSNSFPDTFMGSSRAQIFVTNALCEALVAWDSKDIRWAYNLCQNLARHNCLSSFTWLSPSVLGRLKSAKDLQMEAPLVILCLVGGMGEHWMVRCKANNLTRYAQGKAVKDATLFDEVEQMKSTTSELIGIVKDDLVLVSSLSNNYHQKQAVNNYCSQTVKIISAVVAASPFLCHTRPGVTGLSELVGLVRQMLELRRSLGLADDSDMEQVSTTLLLRGIADNLSEKSRQAEVCRLGTMVISWSLKHPLAVCNGLGDSSSVALQRSLSSSSKTLLRTADGLVCQDRRKALFEARGMVLSKILPTLFHVALQLPEVVCLSRLATDLVNGCVFRVEGGYKAIEKELDPSVIRPLFFSVLVGLGYRNETGIGSRSLHNHVWKSFVFELAFVMLEKIVLLNPELFKMDYFPERLVAYLLDRLLYGERLVVERAGSLSGMLSWAISTLNPIMWQPESLVRPRRELMAWCIPPNYPHRYVGPECAARNAAINILSCEALSLQFERCWPAWDFPWSIGYCMLGSPGGISTCLAKMVLAHTNPKRDMATIRRQFDAESVSICRSVLCRIRGRARERQLSLNSGRGLRIRRETRGMLW